MKHRIFLLSVCLMIVTSCVGVSCKADGSDSAKHAERLYRLGFNDESIARFEQMFQTGEFDFSYVSPVVGNNVLHYAVITDDLNRVKQLLERGANPNVKNRENEGAFTFFHPKRESRTG